MDLDFPTARLRALDPAAGFPFLASALYAVTPVVTTAVPRLATDRHWRTYVNPDYLKTLTPDQAVGVVVHEVWHLLGGTFERGDALGVATAEEKYLWNLSTDAELNAKGELRRLLPPGVVHYKDLGCADGLFAEEVMAYLRKHAPPPPPRPPGVGSGACGSCAGGPPDPWELPPPGGRVPGVTPAQAQVVRAATAAAILEQARQGTVPAGWVLWAKRIFKPKVDYRAIVYRTVTGAVAPYAGRVAAPRRIGRRTPADPRLPTPGTEGRTAQLAVVVDTSGSVSGCETAFGRVLGEVAGVFSALGHRAAVGVYFTDAAAAPCQRAFSLADLRPVGGGGTDMCAGFAAVAADALRDPRLRPDLVICLTDGYTPWPDEPPPYPTLTVVVSEGASGSVPPWGGRPGHPVVRIDPNE